MYSHVSVVLRENNPIASNVMRITQRSKFFLNTMIRPFAQTTEGPNRSLRVVLFWRAC